MSVHYNGVASTMGQLLELKIEQTLLGQQVLNTYQFAETTPEPLSGVAFALAQSFGLVPVAGVYPTGTPYTKLKQISLNNLIFNRFSIRTLYSVTDFYEAPFLPAQVGTGSTTGEASPPFLAFGIKSNRVRTDVRGGHKRIAGVFEGAVDAGGNINAGVMTILQTFCTALSAPLTTTVSGQDYTFSSAILPMTEVTVDGKVKKIFYPNYAAQLAESAIGLTWSPMPQVRSQVSRQYGRGA